MGTSANDSFLRRVHEHAIPARVLDVELAVQEPDDGVPPRHIGVGEDPVVVGETADRPSLDAEDLPACGAQCARLRSHDFQREDHRMVRCALA